MKINENNTYTFNQFLSKEFVLFLKEEIKSIAADQKIAKRDRKFNDNHPCPEKRVYSTYDAYYRVMNNRSALHSLYGIYYFIRKNKNNVDWSKVSVGPGMWGWGKRLTIDPSVKGYKVLDEDVKDCSCVTFHEIVTKYVKANG
jgi:hypothetical protein